MNDPEDHFPDTLREHEELVGEPTPQPAEGETVTLPKGEYDTLMAVYEIATRTQPAEGGEPVAWIHPDKLASLKRAREQRHRWAQVSPTQHTPEYVPLYLSAPQSREREALEAVGECPHEGGHKWETATFHNVEETKQVGRPPNLSCSKCMMVAWLVTTPSENAILATPTPEGE